MNVVVTTEAHFDRTPDDRVWTSGSFSYPFWTRYLAAFDSVRVLARVRDIPVPPAGVSTRQWAQGHLRRSTGLSGIETVNAAISKHPSRNSKGRPKHRRHG